MVTIACSMKNFFLVCQNSLLTFSISAVSLTNLFSEFDRSRSHFLRLKLRCTWLSISFCRIPPITDLLSEFEISRSRFVWLKLFYHSLSFPLFQIRLFALILALDFARLKRRKVRSLSHFTPSMDIKLRAILSRLYLRRVLVVLQAPSSSSLSRGCRAQSQAYLSLLSVYPIMCECGLRHA